MGKRFSVTASCGVASRDGSVSRSVAERTVAPRDTPPRDTVIPLPPRPRVGAPVHEAVLATLIDFAKHRSAAGDSADGAGPGNAVAWLYQIVWELEADEARTLIEAVLALLEPRGGAKPRPVRAEVAAMRTWLERHPR